ncbi:MAG TPA: adenosylcobalamin-dependent ribonucleoside-diphosphate reductase [Pseudomonadales bacterium]|nr:adenosylcobalamin-dependent ribonucleoside-diphosphate reductase [Pseudomonadales bacterium]
MTTARVALEPQRICIEALRDKYCGDGESTALDVQRRVARALAAVEAEPARWEAVFLDAQQRGVVMGGRIDSSAGTDRSSTWINCFVQPIADSISEPDGDGRPGIYVALTEATETMRRGGGVGYDFSQLRPRGAYVRTTQSEASGPVSYMRVFDRSCETVESAGARRGAQMAILRIDHPDVLEFVHAKTTPGELVNFNMSVAVTDDFMQRLQDDRDHELVHRVGPAPRRRTQDTYQRADGMWVYRRIKARELWDAIMRSTYDHGEPGILFIDRVNADNNLAYCERIEATNPCAEQPLPPYGCCCLGSIDLTRCIVAPFAADAAFDFDGFGDLVRIAVRMLDDVLDATPWPLPQQRAEAHAKRRIGLGFLGLGDALVMLGLRYDSDAGRAMAVRVATAMRDNAYRASIDLAAEKGAFPLFGARYLDSSFVLRLPADIRAAIAQRGIRNSHLLSIAPTGTISLAFADNASNGIEPAYAWTYQRRKRDRDGVFEEFTVEDHAYRLFRSLRDDAPLTGAFVSALEIGALDHAKMVGAVQPFIDSAISKTVNIPVDYPFAAFRDLYHTAWTLGAKSLATFRPNTITGSVLTIGAGAVDAAPDRGDRRVEVTAPSTAALSSLRWPRRPTFKDGNPAHCYMVKHPHGQKFALFVGHFDEDGRAYPFEVWVNGVEQPRGLNALAINLSYDMYARDRGWLRHKLDALNESVADEESFDLPMPPTGTPRRVPSLVAAMATLIRYRCEQLGAFANIDATPVLDALMTRAEPRTGADGTLSWTVDIANPSTGDEFILGLKELQVSLGDSLQRRPYAMWLSGTYPRALDGLCKALSLDMRVIDPAWIAKKLRELLTYAEPKGDFFAPVPDSERRAVYPSTVAYVATLVLHRYARLGILDGDGFPIAPMGLVRDPNGSEPATPSRPSSRRCEECGARALIRVDGCDRCTVCGAIGVCG